MRQEQELLGRQLERALAGRELETLFPTSKGIAGLDAAALALAELARCAVRRLRAREELLPAEVQALELGIRLARPALRVNEGKVPRHQALGLSSQEYAAVEAILPGVAAIEVWGECVATGFQVSRSTLLTNRHVIPVLMARGALSRGAVTARFDADGRTQRAPALRILQVLDAHPKADIALLSLEGDGPLEAGLRVACVPRLRREDPVLVIGHPTFSLDLPYFAEALFEQVYSVKRVSPGELHGITGEELHHDCSTLLGNSGSPIIDCRTGQVVGVHSSAISLRTNIGVPAQVVYQDEALRSHVEQWE